MVAAEVREIAAGVGVIAEQLQAELATQIDTLSHQTHAMANAAKGSRMVDLALNAIEIIDRNLYERTCDVRWWATDSAVVDCATTLSAEAVSHASRRLGVILDAYTVDLDLWLCGLQGRVIANGRPDRYAVTGLDVAREPWFTRAAMLASGDDFAVCDIATCNGLNGAQVATYAASVRADGESRGAARGVLAIHFDWAPSRGHRPRCQDRSPRGRPDHGDAGGRQPTHHRVVGTARHAEAPLRSGDCQPLERFLCPERRLDSRLPCPPGYETYRGLGWYGVILQESEREV